MIFDASISPNEKVSVICVGRHSSNRTTEENRLTLYLCYILRKLVAQLRSLCVHGFVWCLITIMILCVRLQVSFFGVSA